ncbi:YdcF family protein [Sphingomonas sp. UBA978]|uniref:YdcF family protein n=1 Tax=Sphingomonas sp. UBA978 TaxID=1947536 RepID=UPI0025D3B1FF|nr:YdcF family protein [Sphingomonas sp. UBA978]
MRLRRVLLATALMLTGAPGIGAPAAPAPAAVGDRIAAALSHRLFPLLSAIGADPAAVARLRARPGIAAMLADRAGRRTACGQDLTCIAQALVWTPAEAATLVGAIPTDAPAADDGAAAQAQREIDGVNVVLRTFGLGQVPRYPLIDGAGMIDPQETRARLQAAEWLTRTPRAGSAQALDGSVEFALALLDASDRTDAIAFDPLTGGLNAAAFRRAGTLDWKRWRYSALILTGVGPETPDMPLSPFGKYHVRLAAERFARGEMPFIIVTGGRAHPRATRFTEAEQMRTALIDRYGVPADAILVEPYARHTTTNLRNAARMLATLAAPAGMTALIVCNPGQSEMIASPAFAQRNLTELGYAPGRVGQRLSPTELEFQPASASLRVDPRDPLDP